MKVLPFARQQRAARARRQIAEMNAARKERLMNPPAMPLLPLLPEPPKMETLTVEPMTKREFMQQYVLNRALAVDDLTGARAANQAEMAWDYIEKGCAK